MKSNRNHPENLPAPRWSWMAQDNTQCKFPPHDSIDYFELRAFFTHICKRYDFGPRSLLNRSTDTALITSLEVLQGFLVESTHEHFDDHPKAYKICTDKLTAAAFVIATQSESLAIPSSSQIFDSFDTDDLEPSHLRLATLGLGKLTNTEGLVDYFRRQTEISNPFCSKSLNPLAIDANILDREITFLTGENKKLLIRSYFKDELLPLINQMISEKTIEGVPNKVRDRLTEKFYEPTVEPRQVPFEISLSLTSNGLN